MGILDRILEDSAQEAVLEAEQALAEQAVADEIAATRAAIVLSKIKELADSMDEDCLELKARGGARIFLFGDIVLAVRLRGTVDKTDRNKTARKDVLWQYTVAIVGLDIVGTVHEAGPGTLALVSYDSLKKVINLNSNLEFLGARVLPHVWPQSS